MPPSEFDPMFDEEVLGAGSDIASIIPWLGLLSGSGGLGGLLGGGQQQQKPADGQANAVQMMQLQLEQQKLQAKRDSDKMKMFMLAGFAGLTLIGVVALLARRK